MQTEKSSNIRFSELVPALKITPPLDETTDDSFKRLKRDILTSSDGRVQWRRGGVEEREESESVRPKTHREFQERAKIHKEFQERAKTPRERVRGAVVHEKEKEERAREEKEEYSMITKAKVKEKRPTNG